jgi:hypothetical protein
MLVPYGVLASIMETTTSVRSVLEGFTPHSGCSDDAGDTDNTFGPFFGLTLMLSCPRFHGNP